MHTSTPRKLLSLRVSHRDGLRRCGEAVPYLLEQLEPVRDAERQSLFEYAVHGTLHSSFSSREVSTHNDLAVQRRASDRPKGGSLTVSCNGGFGSNFRTRAPPPGRSVSGATWRR